MAKVSPEEVAWLKHYYQEGLEHLKSHRLRQAEDVFASIVTVLPEHLGARFQLASVHMLARQFDVAAREFAAITHDFPEHAESHTNLGSCYLELGRLEAARGAYEAALACDPADHQAKFNLGVIQAAMGDVNAAIATYQQLLQTNPDHSEAHINLGALYTRLRQPERARQHYREANRLRPHDPVIVHALAVLNKDPSITAMPPSYARALFDGAALTYDHQLMQGLHYAVPETLDQVLRGLALPPGDALDLGCGTGLCGAVMRPYAKRLVGVDVSPNMLAVAKQKGMYDALHEADIDDTLALLENAYDVIVAGDVFVYLGELTSVLKGCHRALRAGGYLLFTVETGDTEGQPYALQDTGRFRHEAAQLTQLAGDIGFEERSALPLVLREQAGVPVSGRLFVWQKSVQ